MCTCVLSMHWLHWMCQRVQAAWFVVFMLTQLDKSVYTCMRACMYECARHVCVCVCIKPLTCACVYVRVSTRVHVCISYVHMCVCICACAYVRVHMCASNVHMCVWPYRVLVALKVAARAGVFSAACFVVFMLTNGDGGFVLIRGSPMPQCTTMWKFRVGTSSRFNCGDKQFRKNSRRMCQYAFVNR